jgi:NAD(P)-dependent dehydrogenase (short-subunit alcohol dehydrogenase family)
MHEYRAFSANSSNLARLVSEGRRIKKGVRLMLQRFANQIALVTGGSTGIGYAIAKALLDQGAKRVYLTGRSAPTLEEAAKSLGTGAVTLISDVVRLDDLQVLKEEIVGRGDGLDMIFANAGIAENNLFGQTTEGEFAKTFNINVRGIFFTVQTLLPLLKDAGAIILTGSIVGNKGMEKLSLYNASKAAVRSFARSWSNDLKDRKIRVNCLSPGFTRTPIMENGLKLDATQIEGLKDYVRSAVPLGAMAHPDEIASAALFLASNEARYITGIELTVDGGFTMI